MNPRPLVLLTVICLLYSGCERKGKKFIFVRPAATVFSKLATYPVPVTDTTKVAMQDMSIYVVVNIQEINVAGIQLPGNSAYALSIKEPDPIPLERINDIRVRPVYAYNDGYNAMDDISAICTFSRTHTGMYTVSKEEILEGINHAGRYVSGHYFYIFLKEPPSGMQQQQFVIELITDNNGRLADTTGEFFLTP